MATAARSPILQAAKEILQGKSKGLHVSEITKEVSPSRNMRHVKLEFSVNC
jgi:hypothetical protein